MNSMVNIRNRMNLFECTFVLAKVVWTKMSTKQKGAHVSYLIAKFLNINIYRADWADIEDRVLDKYI